MVISIVKIYLEGSKKYYVKKLRYTSHFFWFNYNLYLFKKEFL